MIRSIFLFLLLCLGGQLSAQLSLGIRTGIRVATMDGFEESLIEQNQGFDTEVKNIVGTEVGLVVNYQFSPIFSIQGEINYVEKGAKAEQSGTLDILFNRIEIESQFNFDYIEFAPLAKLTFGGKDVGGFVQVGPSFGYALDGKGQAELRFQGDVQRVSNQIDFEEDNVSRIDWGAVMGAGAIFNFDTFGIFLDGRYNIGFTGVFVEEVDMGDDEIKIRNRGVSATVGILVPIVKK